jgi:ribonuclease HI
MLAAIEEERVLKVIVPISRSKVMWEHRCFQILKKGGKEWRKVVDCSELNGFLLKRKFKMEDQRTVQRNIRRMMWGASIDISKAYWQIPVDPEATPYLAFSYDNQTWAYTAMPFGLSTAPRTFTLLMRVCVQAIRQRWKLTASHFLDDLLFLHEDRQYLQESMPEIVRFLEWLGWVVNKEKSDLIPKQQFIYLGLQWDTTAPSVCLPKDQVHSKLQSLHRLETTLLTNTLTTARTLARTIGDLGSSRFQHRQASLHLKQMDALKLAAIATSGWDGPVLLPSPPPTALTEDIAWWKETLRTNTPRYIAEIPPQAILWTDASPIGWGAHVLIHSSNSSILMHGRWRRKATSNALECAAVERALRTLRRTAEGKALRSIIVRSDNTTTCFNINRQNSCDTLLPSLLSLLRFLERSEIQVVAEHVAGVDNSIADKLSRISPGGDYSLKQEHLEKLLQRWGLQIDADLFAKGWNAKHHLFFSPEKDRLAQGRNAFLVPWRSFRLSLLHPPLPLLPRVLQRLWAEKMAAILITPDWTRQPWSESLRQMTIKKAILGPAESVLVKGKSMQSVRAELPPGDIAAVLVDTRTIPANHSSTTI